MKKLLSFLFCVLLTASTIANTPWGGNTAASFAGGSGTSGDPYQIATAEQLAYLVSLANAAGQTSNGNTSGKYYKLTADIDLNGSSYSWTPIGTTTTNAFAGIFDGDNHIISNIYINSTAVNQGLFGYVVGTSSANPSAIVKNVTIGSGSITTTANYAGAIAARCQFTQVLNCKNTIPVIGLAYSSGIVGRADGVSIIENCGNTGIIKSTAASSSYTAGIVASFQGLSTNGTTDISYIRSCYNRGAVSAASYSGGIVGNGFGYLTIEKCFNTAPITVTTGGSAGIIGYGYNTGTGLVAALNISNCYNTGAIKASATVAATNCAGGILGYVGTVNTRYFGTILNCYNTGTITGNVKEPIAGQLYGATGGGTGTVTNSYFLATSGTNTIANDGTSVATAATLQGYSSTLNNSQAPTVWQDDTNPNFNGGYPILSWVASYIKLTAPTVQSPTNITSTSFTANWSTVSNAIGYYVNVYTNASPSVYTTSQYVTSQASTSATFTSGLTSNTSYIYKIIAVSPSGTSYIDSEESGSTVAGLGGATVLLNSYTQASTTSINANCSVNDGGGTGITARGICYATSTANPTTANSTVVDPGTGNGTYSATLSGLAANTIYYFRAYATNNNRTNYSVVSSFKILSIPTLGTVNSIVNNGFTAVWNAVTGATGYAVMVYDGASLYSTINVSGGSTTSCDVNSLTGSGNYTYSVIAKGNGSTILDSDASIASGTITTLTTYLGKMEVNPISVSNKNIILPATGDIRIFSLQGSLLIQATSVKSVKTELSQGTYLVHFTDQTGKPIVQKLLIH